MSNVRREDLRMKVPALLHLSRLGYVYLTREQLQHRDRRTNLLPDAFRDAVDRINHTRITEDELDRLTEVIPEQLDEDDLGKQFYTTMRNGWNGLRLIDFEHPENNLFHCAAELSCGSGAGSFRPDITLFVNGLPLAMIEVKTEERVRGLLTEYHRMIERFRSKEARRFLQCAQVWAFSNEHTNDTERLMPLDGAFFAAAAADEFPVYIPREKHSGIYSRLLPRDQEREQTILTDNGIDARPHSRDFQRCVSPGKMTHRMLTTLFHPERFLFLLRYGIQYIQKTDHDGKTVMTRRMLTTEQLAALNSLAGKAKRGYLNRTAPSGGAAGEEAANASLVALMRDLEPGARLYWISADDAELQRDLKSLQSCGISCSKPENAKDNQVILTTADGDPRNGSPGTEEPDSATRRVYILPQPVSQYGRRADFTGKLRKSDPSAIIITRKTNRIPESRFPSSLPVRAESGLYCVSVTTKDIR